MIDIRHPQAAEHFPATGAVFGLEAQEIDAQRIEVSRYVGHQRARERVNALLEDETTARCGIEVAAVSQGVIELTGAVGTPNELRRAVEVTQRVDGVNTVVNRLEVGMENSRMNERQRRYESGDPALREQHWYGVGVGTGRRRQGASTDPEQRDDRVEMVTDAFEAEAEEASPDEELDLDPPTTGSNPPA